MESIEKNVPAMAANQINFSLAAPEIPFQHAVTLTC